MNVTATEAKNRLGQVLDSARREPVFIEKAGRPHSVALSAHRYGELLRAEGGVSMEERRRRFNEQYTNWIDEQNRRFDERGPWNEDLRTW